MKKTFDIVLFGATGFTGKRAATYLKAHLPKDVTWAIAGRDASKLTALKATLDNVESMIVDGLKHPDVQSMVSSTRCVLSLAGPFCRYSSLVVEECAKQGVHYVDITGESAWVAEMMRKHEATAKSTGAKIINSCGFDSVPADIGVTMLQRFFRQRWQTEVVDVEAFYYLRGGGLNGGTLLSALEMMQRYDRAEQQDPLLLAKQIQPSRVKPLPYSFSPSYSRTMKRWVTPFVMESVNSKVVYRSQHLVDQNLAPAAYSGVSKNLSYREYQVVKSRKQALLASMAMRTLSVVGGFSPVSKIIESVGPKSGEGPSEQALAKGCFDLKMVGVDGEGHYGMMEMHFPGDAGNAATIMFACEAVITLLLDQPVLADEGGFFTPATGLGDRFIKRLTNAKLTIETNVYPKLIRSDERKAG